MTWIESKHGDRPATGVRYLGVGEAADFARDVVLAADRDLPVVAVTTSHRGESWIDAEALARELAGAAQVVHLVTGDATWELTDALPPRLDVYGAAARIWWPGVSESSDPYGHPLLFVHSPQQAPAVCQRIIHEITGRRPAVELPPDEERREEPCEAVVTMIDGSRVDLSVDGEPGLLRYADFPLDMLATQLEVGQTLPVRRLRAAEEDGRRHCTAQGLLASAWQRVADDYGVDDVVVGRVVSVKDFGFFVELLPGAVGLVHKSKIDYDYVEHPSHYVRRGQQVHVKILSLEPERRRAELSLRNAHGSEPMPRIALIPGGRPFPPEEAAEERAPAPTDQELETAQARIEQLDEQLSAAEEDRRRQVAEIKRLRAQIVELRKDLRGEQDRRQRLEQRAERPERSERAFLKAVRVAYARTFGEDDRLEHPLGRMHVGPQFLASLRKLEGIPVQKVVEVCAQVACGVARTIPGREVHQLRAGEGGSPSVERRSDGARAWRCSLQDDTPSARRLHWWRVPGAKGGVVEFAQVGVHDDFTIPE